MYTPRLFDRKTPDSLENAKNFFIDICKCFINEDDSNGNNSGKETYKYYYYGTGDSHISRYEELANTKAIGALAKTKKEASWILLILQTLMDRNTRLLIDLLTGEIRDYDEEDEEDMRNCYDMDEVVDLKVCINFTCCLGIYMKESENRINIYIPSIDDILYYLENYYPKPIYHIMSDIRQLDKQIQDQKQQIQDQKQQIKGLTLTIANLKHTWI